MTPPIREDSAVALIPARGGSKSIPLKNLISLNGQPLIHYVIAAGLNCTTLEGVYCSTDHDGIADYCRSRQVTVIPRPEALGGDDSPVADVMRHALAWIGEEKGYVPGILALLQPTSPLLLADHITASIEKMRANPQADSVQTVVPVLHNTHAYNQRTFLDGQVAFHFAKERKLAYNKQRKPAFFQFGNLVTSRSRALLDGGDPFGAHSLGIEVARHHSLDVDGRDDIAYAEFLLKQSQQP
ncbi:MAG: acylneuraminate cytidylyltransferase family protein [Magnetococcales bacterium]|nr:acylneuraminate cytidylyltransferase family protein [Magnetococcales bacterium]